MTSRILLMIMCIGILPTSLFIGIFLFIKFSRFSFGGGADELAIIIIFLISYAFSFLFVVPSFLTLLANVIKRKNDVEVIYKIIMIYSVLVLVAPWVYYFYLGVFRMSYLQNSQHSEVKAPSNSQRHHF